MSQHFVEHISEREDLTAVEKILSANVSLCVIQKGHQSRRGSSSDNSGILGTQLHTFSSASILTSSSKSACIENTLECLATAIHILILQGHKCPEPLLYLVHFDERRRPVTDIRVPEHCDEMPPSSDTVLQFLRNLFIPSNLSPETAVISLVYMHRVMAYTSLSLHAATWRRVVLGAVMLACKVWDDLAVWNVDFCQLLPAMPLEDLNDLELTYLEMLSFNMDVDSRLYSQCCFELHALSRHTVSLDPLSAELAEHLKTSSTQRRLEMQRSLRPTLSLDCVSSAL